MGREPGFYFYSGDWLKDPLLRMCSKAAKGCWIDMLAILDGCPFRGAFVTATGVPWTDQEIAGALGGDTTENLACLTELLRTGVVSRNKNGAIYSRRMTRDQKLRERDSARKRKERRVTRSKETKCVHAYVTPVVQSLSEEEIEREVEVGSLGSSSKESPPIFVVPDSVEVRTFDCSAVKLAPADTIRSEASFAAGGVLARLEWTGQRARSTYEAQIAKQLESGRKNSQEVAEEMVEAWRLYRVASQGFKIKYGIENFFSKGIWCDRSQWTDADADRGKGADDAIERAGNRLKAKLNG